MPNTPESFQALKPDFEAVAARLFNGASLALSYNKDDSRKRFSVVMRTFERLRSRSADCQHRCGLQVLLMLPTIDPGEECFSRDKLRQKQGSIIMREKFSDEITAANALSTTDLLGWAFDKFHPRLALRVFVSS